MFLLTLLSGVTAFVGSLGGIGGAVLLVPVLTLLGIDPKIAAAFGMLSVAGGALASAPRQLGDGVVHHRLGIVLEIAASGGALAGALLGAVISASLLSRGLAVVAIVAAVAGATRKGLRNKPDELFSEEPPGEWPGSLSGAYRLDGELVPYRAQRLPVGMVAMGGAGLVAGLAGVGGGFIKTPIMSEIMKVPVRVAAATSTFTVGITAATSLIVFAGQDRIEYHRGAGIITGGLIGGQLGARLQQRVHPLVIRRVLSVVLVAIGILLLVRG